MIPIVAGLVSMLADKGLDLLSSAIDGGADKAKEFIEEKTGINLDKGMELTAEEVVKLKEIETTYALELQKLALENKKEDNRNKESYISAQVSEIANARDMQKAALGQEDLFSKRFIYYLATFWSIMSVLYIIGITFYEIPKENIRFADTILGFLLGTIIATIIGYFFGSSIKKDK